MGLLHLGCEQDLLGVPWPPRAPCRHVPTISAPCALCAHSPPFYQLEAHPRQCDFILTKAIFPNKVTFRGAGCWDAHMGIWGGHGSACEGWEKTAKGLPHGV